MSKYVRHIACAISGGVDSAVAALLLKRQGYKLTGVFMRNWDITDETGICSVDKDYEDARYVCQHLNIPLLQVNFVKEYWNEVFCKLVQGYECGLTPNPDVLCNRHIKFDAFHKYATTQLGADAIATGHYARTSIQDAIRKVDPNEGVSLLTAEDTWKDQTLFLCQIQQEALRQSIFPVGSMMKKEVKRLATVEGLEKIAKKKESTGVCFIGKRNFHSFIQEYVEERPGNFIHMETGAIIGQHKGTHYWTLGQRAHIPGKDSAYFVNEIDPLSRQVFLVPGTDHPALFSHSCTAVKPHWINQPPKELYAEGRMVCLFRYQHIHPLQDCHVVLDSGGHLTVHYDRPLRAVAPGQYAVLYQGDECLGGAEIISVGPSLYDMSITGKVSFSKEFR